MSSYNFNCSECRALCRSDADYEPRCVACHVQRLAADIESLKKCLGIALECGICIRCTREVRAVFKSTDEGAG